MEWNSPSTLDQAHFDPAHVFAAGLMLHHIANTAYPIGHVSTMREYRIPYPEIQSFAPLAWQGINQIGLYAHVPFCEKRCGFCEYTVLDPAIYSTDEDRYFNLLLRELDFYRHVIDTPSKTLIGFDIGGGTPSIAKVEHIERLMDAARRCFQIQEGMSVSIETTPKIAAEQPEKIHAYYQMGIRRISMGVQTISSHLLADMGRTATSIQYNRTAAEAIRAAGFKRFNVDVMYGFAHQPLDSVEATLRHVIDLQPEYVTLYRMRYKGTRIASQAQNVSLEEVNIQSRLAKDLLQAGGYQGSYGKNTFSRLPGDAGTSDYLTRRVQNGTPYLGLGLGAQSLSHQTLSYNSGAADKQLRMYQQKVEAGLLPIQDLYYLSPQAAMGKMISVSFYFGEILLDSFRQKFGIELAEAFPDEVDFILRQGLMELIPASTGERSLRLTAEGEKAYNGVIALFYAGAVKAHLIRMACSSLPCFSSLERQTIVSMA